MKKKTAWYLVGVLILALALMTIACAKPAEEPAAPAAPTAPVKEAPAPAVPAKEAPTTPAAKEPAPTPTGPPAIPHSLEGRADCLVCHQAGGLKPYPADHAGRTSATCTACHQPAPVK